MPEHKIFKIDKESEFFESIMDMGRGIKRLKNEFAQKTAGANLPVQHTPQLEDILSDYNKKKTSELGMDHAVICVQDDNPQAYPRAYEHKPVIFGTAYQTMESGKPKNVTEFFLFSPVGYDGDYFQPDGLQMVTDEQEEKKIGQMLFAEGWTDPAFRFFDRSPVGVALPNDYERPIDQPEQPYKSHAKQTYLVGGATLDLIDDYKDRLKDHGQKTSDAIERLKSIVMNDLKEEISGIIDHKDDYYANISVQGNDMFLSVRMEGKSQMMMAGQPIALKDNAHFDVQEGQYNHEYKVVPKIQTEQGKALSDAISAIPVRPSLGDYDELVADFPFEENDIDRILGTNGHTPLLQNIQGYDVLIYNTDDTEDSAFCPDGCTQLSPAIYFWLEKDRQDMQMGISPPPAPESLLQELSDFSNSTRLGYQPGDHDLPEP